MVIIMNLSRAITEQLERVCGLKVEECELPPVADDVYVDEQSDRTVFVVTYGGKSYAFDFAGRSTETAALARAYILSTLGTLASPDEALRTFIDGGGGMPVDVHIGKSDYYVFAIYCKSRHATVRDYLATVAESDDFVVGMDNDITVFCKCTGRDTDYRSAGEFALVLHENISEEIKERVKIGIGGVAHGVSELPIYYKYAKSALVGGAEFDPNSDIYSYKEYALIQILSELPKSAMEKYVKTALDKNYREVLNDDELMAAADAFIKRSLNISEASRSMYVHRNTLIYRIDKIERMTGLDIRNFTDAMTFRVAYLIYKNL